MAENSPRLNHVESCQLGRIGSGGIALKIVVSPGKNGVRQFAEYALSPELARSLADALKSTLEEQAQN